MGVVLTGECERARARVSLGLDGELTEAEQAMVRAHVGRCAACAGFAREVEAWTRELRAAPLERVAVAGMPQRRRGGVRLLQVGAAAAAIVCAAGLGSLAGSLHSRPSPGFRSALTGTLWGAPGNVAMAPRDRLPAGRVVGRPAAL